MLTRRILRQKKAISPILATLLLIVIAVAAIVVTYAWITTYMNSTTQQAGVILHPANVAFTTGGGVTIDVQNTGNADTKIAAVYIGESPSNATQQTTEETLPLSLRAGEIVSVTIDGFEWTSGDTYYFKVAPTTGPILAFQEQAPQ
jgi:flagellin-like protein